MGPMSDSSYIAVGTLVGCLSPSDQENGECWIRSGANTRSVPQVMIVAWNKLHHAPLQSREDILSGGDNEAVLDALVDNGIVYELPSPDNLAAWPAVIRGLRAIPTSAMGLGVDEDGNWNVVLGGAPVQVSQLEYFLWAACDGAKSLYDVLNGLVAKSKDPKQLAVAFPGAFLGLVSKGLVTLDLVSSEAD